MTSTPHEAPQRSNGLNLVRLALATAVLVAHALLVAGVPAPEHTDIGYWAVAGFFCISGYLVTRSATRLSTATYLRHRVMRLLPAYWTCLAITGLVIAPLATSRPSLLDDGLRYVVANAGLVVTQSSIAGTPTVGHYPGEWNASLWTLWHEFACYLVVGALVLTRAFRGAGWAKWGVAWLTATGLHIALLRVVPEAPFLVRGFIRLLPLFLAGALVQAFRPLDKLRLHSGVIALVAASATVAALPAYGLQLSAPLLAYGLLAVGQRLPSPRVIAREDISYGTYLYAFPATQLMAYSWLPRGGWAVLVWLACIVAITIVLASLSWMLVEKRALRWARRSPDARGREGRGAPAGARHSHVDGQRSTVPDGRNDAGSRSAGP